MQRWIQQIIGAARPLTFGFLYLFPIEFVRILTDWLGKIVPRLPSAESQETFLTWVATPVVVILTCFILWGSAVIGAATRQWLDEKPRISIILVSMMVMIFLVAHLSAALSEFMKEIDQINMQARAMFSFDATSIVRALQLYLMIWGMSVAFVAKLYWDYLVLGTLDKLNEKPSRLTAAPMQGQKNEKV